MAQWQSKEQTSKHSKAGSKKTESTICEKAIINQNLNQKEGTTPYSMVVTVELLQEYSRKLSVKKLPQTNN